MEEKEYALVTGATGGLGKAFVYVLAQRGKNLLLTGRSEEKLAKLQAELQEKYPQIAVRIYPADLSNEGSRYAITAKIRAIRKDSKNAALARRQVARNPLQNPSRNKSSPTF